ncbi:hypothetical protein [Xenophilus sp. Marseille-Q4582]|uniref:hypothetical protein n=1 Tax=Xenophilus sp. Marseille-Q4582 TaxID=2866600 RepID=UPI001CE3D1FE|nr:hypothetical protein [Xenophilus sp. Marseille-Q4582]
MHNSATDISMPVAKAATAIAAAVTAKADVADQVVQSATAGASYATWSAINAIPWGTIASILAGLYTALLMGEWFWKKFWRPMLERLGWIKPKKRYVYTASEWAELRPGADE